MLVNPAGETTIRRQERAVRSALAAHAYHENIVRFVDRRITGFSCLVASRQGLFAVSPSAAKLVAHGLFFGLRRHGELLYLFETCDPARGPSRMGRVVRMRVDQGRLCDETVMATGLDNQCHQLALIGSHVCVIDTSNQAIVRIAADGSTRDRLTLFGEPVGEGYHHINSIAWHRGHTLVMLHNGTDNHSRPSELAWLDHGWRMVRRETLPCAGCHDIVADEMGLLWHCGSMEGTLFNADGFQRKVSDRLTRGLAFAKDSIIVGTSQFALREGRTDVGGTVLFLDKGLNRIAEVELSGAPTEIALL